MQETQLVIQHCTRIIIQSTFSIYKTYNTNTFILYIHRFSLAVAATVILKSEVPGIIPAYLVVVNLAHPRARHGLREFPASGLPGGLVQKLRLTTQQKDPPDHTRWANISHSSREMLSTTKKITQNWPQKIGIQPMPWVTWATVLSPRNSWKTFPCFHLCAGTQLKARIARLKQWEITRCS